MHLLLEWKPSEGKENKVYRLYKVLYGLKKALRAWNSKIDFYFHQYSFEICQFKPSFYAKKKRGDFMMVDDLIIYAGLDAEMVVEFKKSIMKEYEMTDLRCVLGIQVKQSSEEIFISQEIKVCCKSA